MRKMLVVLTLFSLNLGLNRAGIAEEKDWGTLKGTFLYDGDPPKLKPVVKKGDRVRDPAICAADEISDERLVVDPQTGGFANVVIYLAKRPKLVHPDFEPAANVGKVNPVIEVDFDQEGCRFDPHVLIARTNQHILLKSRDPIAHNVHTFPVKNSATNMILMPKDRTGVPIKSFKTAERLPIKISCDIHPWMTAYWVIVDHPYAAVTNKQGQYEIANLPVGDHEFIIWHETTGYIDKKYAVTIKDGVNQMDEIYLKTEAEAKTDDQTR